MFNKESKSSAGERPILRVLIYRPPWRNGEPYFRARQVADYFAGNGDQVKIVAGPRGWRSLMRLLSWFWYLFFVDLIFLYPQPMLPLFALLAKLFGRRVVIDHYVSSVHLFDLSYWWARWQARCDIAAYRKVDATIAHTETVAEAIEKNYDIPKRKIHIVYSLVDTAVFSPTPKNLQKSQWLRRELGLTNHLIVFYHTHNNLWQ